MNRCIVASGSLGGGHELYGPFDNPREAIDWADNSLRPHTFTVLPLECPDGADLDGHEYEPGESGRIVMMIGDGYNGYSVVGMFDTPEHALDWENNYDADSDGYNVMWVEVSDPSN
jgi:hypothetical protein